MKKGISLIAVVATVIVLSILTGTIVITSISASNNAKITSLATELLSLQNILKQEKQRGTLDKVLGKPVTIDMTKFVDAERYQFSMEQIVDNKMTFYEVDLVMLNSKKLTRGAKKTAGDIYAYSKETGRVYYVDGVKIDKVTYYGLYGELSSKANISSAEVNTGDYIERSIVQDGIEVMKSEVSFTNKWVSTELKLPSKCTEITVTSTEGIVTLVSQDDTFTTYSITKGGSAVKNYTVTANYKYGNTSKSLVTSVNNIDLVPPPLATSNISQNYIVDSSNKIVAMIEVKNVTDEISGLKNIKYEKGTVFEPYEYFKSAGKIAENNIIPLEYSDTYTICAEDNAGNISILIVNIENSILEKIIQVK